MPLTDWYYPSLSFLLLSTPQSYSFIKDFGNWFTVSISISSKASMDGFSIHATDPFNILGLSSFTCLCPFPWPSILHLGNPHMSTPGPVTTISKISNASIVHSVWNLLLFYFACFPTCTITILWHYVYLILLIHWPLYSLPKLLLIESLPILDSKVHFLMGLLPLPPPSFPLSIFITPIR